MNDDEVQTDGTSRLGLRLLTGVSIRLDTGTRARLISPDTIALTEGALYVDNGGMSNSLEIRTPFGVLRDVGTQFELRVGDSSLRVRVRSGLVELRRGDEIVSAPSRTELTIALDGIDNRDVAPYGPEWDWAGSLAPAFEIDGRPLSSFLEHLCREHGWTLRYADSALSRRASGIILRGSVDGLRPTDALAVAFATSELTHRLEDGELTVTRVDDDAVR